MIPPKQEGSLTVPLWKKSTGKGQADLADHIASLTPPRQTDLVERDGIRRFGPLFVTGSDQWLGSVTTITLYQGMADMQALLDMESGRIYEEREGVSSTDRYVALLDLSDHSWMAQQGIDLAAGNGIDSHFWLIGNDRWESIDSEIVSAEPLELGREAESFVPFDQHPLDFRPDLMGTFLFATREGTCGILRAYPWDDATQSRRIEYRLWNRDAIVPYRSLPTEPKNGRTWTPVHAVLLKEPDIGKECLFDFTTGKARILPRSVGSPPTLLSINDELQSRSIFTEEIVAVWARSERIDVATIQSVIDVESNDEVRPTSVRDGKISGITMLDSRLVRISEEGFDNLSVSRADKILKRESPLHRIVRCFPPYWADQPRSTYAFDTKSGIVGLIQILHVGEHGSSIGFRYKVQTGSD